MLYQPQIIVKCLSTQSNYMNRVFGQMFYYTDKRQIWYDTQNGNRVYASDIYILDFERERNNFIPTNINLFPNDSDEQSLEQRLLSYLYIYVVETNCLYSYVYASQTWTRLYGVYGSTTVAQTYLPNGDAVIINADDVTTNGILNDGSVVVRDSNKMICGQLLSNGYTFTIKSLIGGQINLQPSSTSTNGDGCLQLNSENNYTNLNNNLTVFGNITTTAKENWKKQYRLVTQDILINSYSLIKEGSTLVKGSKLNNIDYTEDTKLTEDVIVQDNIIGNIITGSKLYINSIINNVILKPPYLFDIDETNMSYANTSKVISDDLISVDNETLVINVKASFSNIGDKYYIKSDFISFKKIVNVKFLDDDMYNIVYRADKGTDLYFSLVYYGANNLKILP